MALQTMTDRFRSILREADLICRYGGEEFAILLPDCDLAGAQAAAQRLYTGISRSPMKTDAGQVSITISIGVAMVSDECQTLETLLKCADMALYTAKQDGRNCISIWNAHLASQS